MNSLKASLFGNAAAVDTWVYFDKKDFGGKSMTSFEIWSFHRNREQVRLVRSMWHRDFEFILTFVSATLSSFYHSCMAEQNCNNVLDFN